MNKEKVKQRIENICNKYAALISAAPTDEEKEQLEKEFDWEKRRVYFGAEMQRRRKEAGKTQKELGVEIGKSEPYIKQMEAGLIPMQEKGKTVDKLVKSLSGWSRWEAYNMLKIENQPISEAMTIDEAKEAFVAVLLNCENVHQFILQVLYIKTNYDMDYRKTEKGDFLKSQEAAKILFNLTDLSAAEIANAFFRVGVNVKLTQKQWERIFRYYKKVKGKSFINMIDHALANVISDPEEGKR